MDIHWFAGKKVVLMGLGLHGGGVALAKWLYAKGSRVIITDLKSREELSSSIERVNSFCRQFALQWPDHERFFPEYHLGGHAQEDFLSADLVLQNPGVPRESSYLTLARQNAIPIENEATLFFLLTKKTPKLCVTGTRGKSTTTGLIGHILKKGNADMITAGIATKDGTLSFFDILDRVHLYETEGRNASVVLELSSWHLEHFENHPELSPSGAVITNVFSDHLNRYEGFEQYLSAKKRLYEHQSKEDFVVLNYDNAETLTMGRSTTPKRYWFSRKGIPPERGTYLRRVGGVDMLYWKDEQGEEELCARANSPLIGDHNTENILAAVAAVKAWGVPAHLIADALPSFSGVQGRLEKIGKLHGREWINDTTSTSPDALVAALKALGREGERRIVLIAGGADKKLDFSGLGEYVSRYATTVVLLTGTATPLLAQELSRVRFDGVLELANTMGSAVEKAWNNSKKGDMILLSPGCASFGMFAHEFERGKQFESAIQDLTVHQ